MKFFVPLIMLLLMSCGGSLSDEQRGQMRQKMEENRIVHVTEVEIIEAAFAEGRRAVGILDSLGSDSAGTKKFVENYNGDIRFIKPDKETARLLEQQLIDAYLADSSGAFQDNVQNVRDKEGEVDSILYTRPVSKKLEDGRDELVGVWNIWLSKKELIKEIGRHKPD